MELWFARIRRDVIARGVFTSVADLGNKLQKYIRTYCWTPSHSAGPTLIRNGASILTKSLGQLTSKFLIVGITGQFLPSLRVCWVPGFGDDLWQAVGEAVESSARRANGERTTMRFEYVLSGNKWIDHARDASADTGQRRFRLGNEVSRSGAGELEFPPEQRPDSASSSLRRYD